LIITAVAVLLFDYSLVEISSVNLSIGALELSEVKISDLLLPIAAFALVITLLIYHLIYSFEALTQPYRSGYSESPRFQKLVGDEVAKLCGNRKHGSPCGGLNHSFRRKSYDLGRFQHEIGYLTDPVIINPSLSVHFSGVLYGLRRCLSIRLCLSQYAPALLAIWALIAIAV
jgi:hypothetical protein